MLQYVWVNALIAGMVSACSMPLGSLTALIWTPKNRALALCAGFFDGLWRGSVTVSFSH